MELTVLGSVGWMPTARRNTAGYIVRDRERLLVFHAGTGVGRMVIEPALIDGVTRIDVVLSPFHLDHVVGLSYLSGIAGPVDITVHGPGRWLYERQTTEIVDNLIGVPYQPTTLAEHGVDVEDLQPDGMAWGPHQLTVHPQLTHVTTATSTTPPLPAISNC